MRTITEADLSYIDIYKELNNLAHTFERNPPQTEAVCRKFLINCEGLAKAYLTIPQSKRQRLGFNLNDLLAKIRESYSSNRHFTAH